MKIHRFLAQSVRHAGRKGTKKRLSTERLESKQLLSADGLPGLTEPGATGDPAGEAAQMSTVLSNRHHNAESAHRFTGRVGPIDNDGEFRVENPREEWATFRYIDTTQVVDAAGKDVPLDELEGIKVRVTYHTEETKQVADKVQVCRVQVNPAAPRMNLADDVPLVPLDPTLDATSQNSSFVGRIAQVENDGQVRVKNGKGEWETFTYNGDTEVVDAAGNDVPLDELEGVKVRVTYHTEGTKQVADKIQVCRFQVDSVAPRTGLSGDAFHSAVESPLDATSQSSSFVGRIAQVENDGQVRVKNGKGEWETFTYNGDTEVVDAAGKDVPLDELEGVKVRVTYHTEGTKQVADKIQVCRFQANAIELRSYFGNGDEASFGLRTPYTDARASELMDRLFARNASWYL